MTKQPTVTSAQQPWKPAEATRRINQKAMDTAFSVGLKGHAEEMMQERGITMSDALHVMKYGFVLDEAQQAKEKGWYKYRIEGTTPNSGKKKVRVVVIPQTTPAVAILTVMWVGE